MKKETRLKVYRMYDGHCAYCGRTIEYKDMQVDHIVPKTEECIPDGMRNKASSQ